MNREVLNPATIQRCDVTTPISWVTCYHLEVARNKNWGKGFIEAISEQLRKELLGLRGFSAASLRKMRTFYEEWQILSDNSFVETNNLISEKHNSFVGTNELPMVQFKIDANFPLSAFMNIGFTHHYAIISKVKDTEQRKFYIQFAADTKAKVEDLERMINDDLYSHQGELPNNFKKAIPDQLQAYRAITMFKDELKIQLRSAILG